MNKQKITTLLLSVSVPISSVYAQSFLSNTDKNIQKISFDLKGSKVIVDKKFFDELVLDELMENMNSKLPESMTEYKTASIFMSEKIASNKTSIVISSTDEERDQIIDLIDINMYEALPELEISEKSIEINDIEVLSQLIRKINITKPESMNDLNSAVVFSRDD